MAAHVTMLVKPEILFCPQCMLVRPVDANRRCTSCHCVVPEEEHDNYPEQMD